MSEEEDQTTKERSRLLPNNESPAPTARYLLVSFVAMSIFVSINHSTATALIALSSSSLGDLGRYTVGVLHLVAAVFSLLLSTPFVEVIGFKWGLVGSLFVYCAYVGSFLIVSFADEQLRDPAAIVGATLGGMGAGCLWAAQGGYFTLTCLAYARAAGVDTTRVTAMFGGIFASIYLFCEVGMKLLSSLLFRLPEADEVTVFIVFSFAALSSAIGMIFVADPQVGSPPQKKKSPNSKSRKNIKNVLATIRLTTTNVRMILLLPTQAALGFCSAYLNAYSNNKIITDVLGQGSEQYVGYFAAIYSGMAALSTIPLSLLTTPAAKANGLAFGGFAFLLSSLLFLLLPGSEVASWGWCAVLYSLHGIGRGVFEGTNKAVMADMFPNEPVPAFSSIVLVSATTSGLAYFASPHISGDWLLIVGSIFAFLQIIGSLVAVRVLGPQPSE